MKRFLTALSLVLVCAVPAAAQTGGPDRLETEPEPLPEIQVPDGNTARLDCEDGFEVVIIPKGLGDPIYKCQRIGEIFPGVEESITSDSDKALPLLKQPDYSRLTPEKERTARLDALFQRLNTMEDAETANLVAEEVWAIWLDSGSPSVNLLLKRGTAAQKKGDLDLARLMFGKVTELEPEYAEGWSRSGRLAFDERDFGKALIDVTQALIYEPRHFYALWTLGNIFEQLGRTDEAFEAYSEAHKLYPALKAVEDQMNKLRKDVEGDVL